MHGPGHPFRNPDGRNPLEIRARPFVEVNEGCAASHLTAAELLDLPRRLQKLYGDEITTVHAVRLTTPERTWLDLAETLSVDELVVAGDYCVRIPRPEFEGRVEPLCTVADLQRMIDRHKGKRGCGRPRRKSG